MTTTLYVEINIFACLVLLVIMDKGNLRLAGTSRRLLRLEEISLILVMTADIFTWLLDGQTFAGADTLLYIFQYIYWILSSVPCCIAIYYYYSILSYEHLKKKWCILISLPFIWASIFVCLNPVNHWIFIIDAANVYHRGPYFLAAGGVGFIQMAIAAVIALTGLVRCRAYERRLYRMLLGCMAVAFAGSLVQCFAYGIATIWISVTLMVLMCYVFIQRDSLTQDSLTHLNNRGKFDSYAREIGTGSINCSVTYLIIMDLDRFKQINDTYGHAEGDRALAHTAAALMKAMENEKGLLARIGGDEFAILISDVDIVRIRNLIRRIRKNIYEQNRMMNTKYQISLSIGFASREGRIFDFSELFMDADKDMYENKKPD